MSTVGAGLLWIVAGLCIGGWLWWMWAWFTDDIYPAAGLIPLTLGLAVFGVIFLVAGHEPDTSKLCLRSEETTHMVMVNKVMVPQTYHRCVEWAYRADPAVPKADVKECP